MSGLLVGCRGRAKDELYIEAMSSEIRDLEDQLYEYDYEYRRLEQENESLQREMNYRRSRETDNSAASKPSILDRNLLPSGQNEPRPAPEARAPGSTDTLPTPPSFSNQRGTSGAGSRDTGFENTGDFDLDSIEPPRIEMGEQIPTPVTMLEAPPADYAAAPEDDIELNLSRIEVPALTASHANTSPATLTPAVQQITDRRIVEVAFHPTLSRSADFDGEKGDDGLYLVLIPKNIHGQMVDEPAELAIVVLDPSRPKGQDRIARWDYSTEDVRHKMQPIGAQQGIHLTLPWN